MNFVAETAENGMSTTTSSRGHALDDMVSPHLTQSHCLLDGISYLRMLFGEF